MNITFEWEVYLYVQDHIKLLFTQWIFSIYTILLLIGPIMNWFEGKQKNLLLDD